ncbi:MAG: hypothetical protein WKF75_13090 [Singulisphaera sp.]
MAVAFLAFAVGHLCWILESKRFVGDYIIGFAVAALGWSLAKQARRAYRVFMASVPPAEREAPRPRRFAAWAVEAASLPSIVPLLEASFRASRPAGAQLRSWSMNRA